MMDPIDKFGIAILSVILAATGVWYVVMAVDYVSDQYRMRSIYSTCLKAGYKPKLCKEIAIR